jgi:hypothetical protein
MSENTKRRNSTIQIVTTYDNYLFLTKRSRSQNLHYADMVTAGSEEPSTV